MIETVPPSIALPTPSWAPPSTRTTSPQALKAPKPWPATEPPLKLSSASTSTGVALGGAVVDPGARDRAGELGAEHAVVGVGGAREPLADDLAGEHLVGQAREPRRGLLRLHADRPRAHQAGLGARLDQLLLGDRQVDRLEVQELLQRRDQLGEVEPLGVRDLLQQVVAADQVLGALVAEPGDHALDLLAHRLEEAGAALGGRVDVLRRELLQAVLLGLLDGLDLGRDPDVAGVELAAAADRAAQRDHRQGAEGDPVGPHAVELHDVVGVAVAAVGPDLDPVADPRLHQRPVDRPRADVGRQADVAQGVLPGGAGAALEARTG